MRRFTITVIEATRVARRTIARKSGLIDKLKRIGFLALGLAGFSVSAALIIYAEPPHEGVPIAFWSLISLYTAWTS